MYVAQETQAKSKKQLLRIQNNFHTFATNLANVNFMYLHKSINKRTEEKGGLSRLF
jgi:hypothetical protein